MIDPTIGMSKDEKIIHEAKERFRRAEEWESLARQNYIFDTRFANGDSQNLYQWPPDIARDRNNDNRPCLTINKTKQHCLQIINDQRQNPSQIEVRPTGDGATYESAKVFEGICRHIESISQAQQAYNNACYGQVLGGVGYFRIVTDYASDDSFDQEIFIRRVGDPLSVYLDCDVQEADKSDMNWAFCFKDLPRDQFNAQYPEHADDMEGTTSALGIGDSYDYDAWTTKDHVRVVEYFRRVLKPDRLHLLDNGVTVRESDVKDADLMDQLKINSVQVRDIERGDIEWYLIGASKILDRKQWLGKYIPIVAVLGEETIIDKKLDRRGHTRCLIDPQRIYNYWTSSAVEFVALQSKTPYLTAIEAISGFEENWARANVDNKAYLPYNSLDETGQTIPKPERAPVPEMSQAYLDGLKISSNEMMMVSGQYEANMGQKSNEVSGKAVDARQRQGENSTYHFIDRFANSVRFAGRILIDLIPKVYDTARVVKVLGINGEQHNVQIDPQAAQGHQQLQDPDDKDFNPDAITAIFRPDVGRYEVEADIGPAFATRRQEAFRAIADILQNQESLIPVVGDLLFKAADFPMADEIAERLHNLVPPKALGEDVADPQMQQLQQQLAQQHQQMLAQAAELQMTKIKLTAAEKEMVIKEYSAETDRMKAIGMIDPEAMMPVIRQMVSEALATPINPIIAAHAAENAQMALPALEQAKLDHAHIKLEQAKVGAEKAKTTARKKSNDSKT